MISKEVCFLSVVLLNVELIVCVREYTTMEINERNLCKRQYNALHVCGVGDFVCDGKLLFFLFLVSRFAPVINLSRTMLRR